MEKLLPYYERELHFLRNYAREFSERYPKIAGRLQLAGDVCADPHIERMIESFALLSARTSKRLDDDYPQLTDALFEVLYPHYLRPFPSCSIARFDFHAAPESGGKINSIARGTELSSQKVNGLACIFRNVYPVTLGQFSISHAAFSAIIEAPAAILLAPGATASLSIRIDTSNGAIAFADLDLTPLRVFIDGEASFCATLRDALLMRSVTVYAEADQSGRWVALMQSPLAACGFDEADALIPFPARAHPAYRLLTEYFCFPEKFNFFDIDLAAVNAALVSAAAADAPAQRSITLHLALSGMRSDSNTARMLGTLAPRHLLLGCSPVVNLFSLHAKPSRMTHTVASYPVFPDARQGSGFELYSIDAVGVTRQTEQGETLLEFRPYYCLRHGESLEKNGRYWLLRRNEVTALTSQVHENEISIIDIDFDPAAIETDTLSIDMSCTNRDLPAMLSHGAAGGDLSMQNGSRIHSVSLLRKPSLSRRFERGRGAHWRLISHLSLNQLSLADAGLEAFQEMLTLYDLARTASSQRQIRGIMALRHKAANAWLPGNPFACLVRGLEVTLCIDEVAFTGSGITTFANIIERFLGLYVHANSFTQLVITAHESGEELLRCAPQSGALKLL